MKRIIICLLMLAGIITISIYAFAKADRLNKHITEKIDAVEIALEEKDRENLLMRINELEDYWKQEEKSLVHYIRHSHIDSITISIARLRSLAAHDEPAEVGAELSSIRSQIEHIKNAERLTLANLF